MGQIIKEQNFGAITLTSSTSITIEPSRVNVGGQQNKTTTNTVMDLTTVGVGGLDTGTLVLDTLYYVYAINNSDSLGFVASTALPSVGPTGFTGWTEVGRFRTNASSTDIAAVSYKGQGSVGKSVDYSSDITPPANSTIVASYTRTGEYMTISWRQICTGASTDANPTLPAGHTVNTSIAGTSMDNLGQGSGSWLDSGIAVYEVATRYATTSTFELRYDNGTSLAGLGALGSNDEIHLNIKIPIKEFVGLFD